MDTVTDASAQTAARINPVVTEIVRNGLVAVTEEVKIRASLKIPVPSFRRRHPGPRSGAESSKN